MAFDLGQVVIRVDSVKQSLADTKAGLQQTQEAAADTAESMGKLGTAAGKAAENIAYGMRSAAGTVGATGETFSDFFDRLDRDQKRVLEQIKGPWERYQSDLRATNSLFDAGTITMGEFEGASARLADRLEVLQRRNLSEQLRLEIDLFTQITEPVKRYEQELAALQSLLNADQISLTQFDAALAKVQARAQSAGAIAPTQGPVFKQELAGLASGPMLGPAFDANQAGRGLTEELKHQQQLLEQISGPMKRYEQDLAALDALLKKDQITLEQYNDQLAKMQKRAEAAGAIAPVQGPRQQTPGEESPGSSGYQMSTIQSVVGGAGMLLAGAGVVALGQQIDGLIKNYHDLQDVAIEATNAAMKFSDATHSATVIIDEQIRAANDLHSNYTATVGLYDTVRDGTDDLNISHADQIRLTKTLGEAVQLAGRSMESAEGVVMRLSYAFARGKIEIGDLNRIMRQVPELGDLWTKSFNTDRQGLLAMVREGKIGVEDIVGSLVNEGKTLDDNFAKRQRTNKQLEEEWILNEKLYSQRYNVSFGAGHAAQESINALKKNPEQIQVAFSLGSLGNPLAAEANKQLLDEQKAALGELFQDLQKLEGPFQKLGDSYRKMTGDTAAVRAEVTKLTEPVEAARAEMDTLNQAFAAGKIDIETYEKEFAKLQTTLQHGIPPEAYKLNAPIEAAKKALEDLNGAFSRGDVTFDQYRKEYTSLSTTIEGHMPVLEKIRQPIEDARVAFAELQKEQKAGTINAEEYRKEYDALITTMNDGRLPSVIKLWESFTIPIRDWKEDLSALTILWEQGRISLLRYTDEMTKLVHTQAEYLQQQVDEHMVPDWMRQGWQAQTRTALGGSVVVTPDTRADLERYKASQDALRQSFSYGGDKALAAGVSGRSDVQAALKVLEQQRDVLRDASPEWVAYNAQTERAIALGNELVAPLTKYEQKLGDITRAVEIGRLTEDEASNFRRRARTEYNNEMEALEATKGPMEAYEAALKKLNDQLQAGDISEKQFGDGVDKAKIVMLEATGAAETFKGALEIDWLKAQQGADGLGASTARIFEGDLGKFNDGFITALTGGGEAARQTRDELDKLREAYGKGQISAQDYASKQKELNDQLNAQTDVWANIKSSFSSFVDSMITDIERLLIKWAEMQAVKGIIGLFSAGAGGSTMDAGLVDEFAKGMGFATGGSFVVGGDGGVDTTPVAFRATRGERVTITPPGAYPYMPASQPSAGAAVMGRGAPVIQVHNHYDTDMVTAGITSNSGQTAVLNVLRANRAAIRATLGIS